MTASIRENFKLYTIILTPAGFRNIKKYVNENDIYSVLVNAPLKDRVIRYIDRCKDEFDYSDLTEIQERVNRDFGMFLSVENEVDLTYENIASKDFENDIQKAVTDIVSNTLNKNFNLDAKKKLHETQKENNTLVIPKGTKSVTKRLIGDLCKEKNIEREDVSKIIITDDVSYIGSFAFDGCLNLTSVTIPDSIKCIGNSAFISCINLESVKLPNKLQTIRDYTFASCINLNSIIIPDSIIDIEDYAFINCKKLKNIKIPNGVTNIGYAAFDGCENLKSVTIPESVKNIDEHVFCDCKNLFYVKLGCDISAIENINVFNNCYEDMEIELKDGTVISINELEDILDNRMSNKDEEDYDRE